MQVATSTTNQDWSSSFFARVAPDAFARSGKGEVGGCSLASAFPAALHRLNPLGLFTPHITQLQRSKGIHTLSPFQAAIFQFRTQPWATPACAALSCHLDDIYPDTCK
jgi:hypothetical protein